VASITSVSKAGLTTNVGKVTITSLGSSSGTDNVQLSTNVYLVKDKRYEISFKASADASRNIDLKVLLNASPWSTIFSVNQIGITSTQKSFGSYIYTSTYTGSVAFRFFLGGNTSSVYFDDVVIKEIGIDNAIFNLKNNNNFDLSVYPNPASGLVKVLFDEKGGKIIRLDLVDLRGRSLYSKSLITTISGENEVEFNVSSLENGIYVVRVVNDQGLSETRKLVVRK